MIYTHSKIIRNSRCQELQLSNSTIFTDLFSAINNIRNKNNPPDINVQIQNTIQVKNNEINIQLVWIPGQRNIKENKMADKATKNSVFLPLAIKTQIITKNNLLFTIKIHSRNIWQEN